VRGSSIKNNRLPIEELEIVWSKPYLKAGEHASFVYFFFPGAFGRFASVSHLCRLFDASILHH
jgi:hypothetical protein